MLLADVSCYVSLPTLLSTTDLYWQINALRWALLTQARAQTIFCVGAAKYRIPVYVMQKYDFQQMLEHAQNFRLNELQLVPPLVIAMTKHPLMRQYDLSSVTAAGSGAAPLGAEITANFDKLWPPGIMNMKQGYGMTEYVSSRVMTSRAVRHWLT